MVEDVNLKLVAFDHDSFYKAMAHRPWEAYMVIEKTEAQVIDELRREQTRLYSEIAQGLVRIAKLDARVVELNKQLLDSEKDRHALLEMLKDLGDDGSELVRRTERERLAMTLEKWCASLALSGIANYRTAQEVVRRAVGQHLHNQRPAVVRSLFDRIRDLENVLEELIALVEIDDEANQPGADLYSVVLAAREVLKGRLF